MAKNQIEYFEKIITDAFHGTNIKNSNQILRDGFLINRDSKLRLGDGVYYYESSPRDAENWAFKKVANNRKDVVILRSTLKLGKCLNLVNEEHKTLIKEFYNILRDKLEHDDRNKTKITDSLVINYIAQRYEIETVRAVFTSTNSKRLFAGSHYYLYSQLVICVRKLDNILKTEIYS